MSWKNINEAHKLEEMHALVKMCESTESSRIKKAAKHRLKVLSEIPKDNPFADRIIGK